MPLFSATTAVECIADSEVDTDDDKEEELILSRHSSSSKHRFLPLVLALALLSLFILCKSELFALAIASSEAILEGSSMLLLAYYLLAVAFIFFM